MKSGFGQKLMETAQTPIYSGRTKEARATSLRILLKQIKTLSSSIEELEREIQELLSLQEPKERFPGDTLLAILRVREQQALFVWLHEKVTMLQ
jgi:hypothetical protein